MTAYQSQVDQSPITRQEMFDRAVRGLRSQGWHRAYSDKAGSCMYFTPDGRRCAWGWVDPAGTGHVDGGVVRDLAENGEGLAAQLSEEDLGWASQLQNAHDDARRANPKDLEERMRAFGHRYGLTWPE